MAADPKARNIASLDGLRGLSIAFVIAGHLTGTQNFPEFLYPIRALAGLGVRIFFVISGFLITTLLFQEMDRAGGISLAGFYKRRAFRIFPAFYFYLATIGLLGLASSQHLAHAATYTINYFDQADWTVAHTWSLAVEEQFYLLWPLTLVLLGRRRGLMAAAAVVALSPLIRGLQYEWIPLHRAGIGSEFHTIADSLACGCLLAGFRERWWRVELYRRFLESKWFAVVPMVLVIELAVQPGRPFYFVLAGMSVLNIGITLCIDYSVRFHDRFVGRILNTPSLKYIGVLSYSLYLWQEVFLNRSSTAPWTAFPQNLILASGAALLSYYCVERPMIALGRRSKPPVPQLKAA